MLKIGTPVTYHEKGKVVPGVVVEHDKRRDQLVVGLFRSGGYHVIKTREARDPSAPQSGSVVANVGRPVGSAIAPGFDSDPSAPGSAGEHQP